jgi:hypothetical protein
LLALAGRDYTLDELTRVTGRERMIQSSLYTGGRAEGLAEGRLMGERELCAAITQKHHPAVFDRVRPLIEACSDPVRLKEWALVAPDLTDADFLKLFGA